MKAKILATAVAVTLAGMASASEDSQWGYEGSTGPDNWAELSADNVACAGGQQSPIDLVPETAVDADADSVELNWEAFTPEVLNNGHTIQVNTGGTGGYAELNDKRYDLLQFHFHHESEHSVLGVQRPMEVHFVHAADDGSLLVVGNFIVIGDASEVLDRVWSAIPDVGQTNVLDGTLDPGALVSDDDDAFRYMGSLTTPPCSEIVTWIVKQEPVTASRAQIDTFAALYPNNYRPVQPVNRRFVLTLD